jgi:hypothetical protein
MIISLLLRFINFETLSLFDPSRFVALFVGHHVDIRLFISQVFPALFLGIGSDEYALLFNRYGTLYSFFAAHFGDPLAADGLESAISTFVRAYPLLKDRPAAHAALQKIICERRGATFAAAIFEAIDSVLAAGDLSLLEMLTSLCVRCSDFRRQCLAVRAHTALFASWAAHRVSSTAVLDFVAVLPKHRYLPALDQTVAALLQKFDFLNAQPDELLALACGLRRGQPLQEGSLCFLSILGRCNDFVFTSQSDLWFCGRVRLDLWLRDIGRPVGEFPSIDSVARQYIKVEHCRR